MRNYVRCRGSHVGLEGVWQAELAPLGNRKVQIGISDYRESEAGSSDHQEKTYRSQRR